MLKNALYSYLYCVTRCIQVTFVEHIFQFFSCPNLSVCKFDLCLFLPTVMIHVELFGVIMVF
jgi:hypothetical protein